MEAIAGFILFASLAAFVLGVVNVIRPQSWMKVRKRLVGAFMVLGSMGGCVAGGMMLPPSAPKTEITAEAATMGDAIAAAEVAAANAPAAAAASEPKLTGPQKNAVRSARQYLSMTGFSRDGLIAQLSSEFGDGYQVADATAAVDSLDVDWNENAARSARQYLNMTGFSCNGLVEQLSSDAGDKYTQSQARYGAQAAGAC
ncbi:Ltp family lipoprotein [Brevundimonas sp.]|uniref:Ltp family lipoprotein n=2 Tax=Brevundimonas sp. TaxID=1871086 RepID=UPI0028AD35FA|nr:Ltp family lipoprotein [Brevundimonas sp.]